MKKLIPGQKSIIVQEDGSVLVGTDTQYVKIDNSGNVSLLTDKQVSFRDATIYIYSSADGWLNLVADTGVEVNAPVLNVNGITFSSGGGFDCGDAGGFSGMKFDAGTTTLTFWIDGSQVAHIGTDGVYVNDV